MHSTIDNSFDFSEKQLIDFIFKAYEKTGLTPARVWGREDNFANATGAIQEAYGEMPWTEAWQSPFDFGFNIGIQYFDKELFLYGLTREYIATFELGNKMANIIFRHFNNLQGKQRTFEYVQTH